MATQTFARVVFDRKKRVEEKGSGYVEIVITVGRKCRKFVKVDEATPLEFEAMNNRGLYNDKINFYNDAVKKMVDSHMEICLESLDTVLGLETNRKDPMLESFLDFMYEQIRTQNVRDSTRQHEYTTWKYLTEYGKMVTFADFTPEHIYLMDDDLRKNGGKCDTTCYNYHKHIRKFLGKACDRGIIPQNPYDKCHFKKGKYKERTPLNEEELVQLRELNLKGPFEKARDLFLFAAYTGLAYVDVANFDYDKMVIKVDNMYYIDGSRIKTGVKYFTPILPVAMQILKKYMNKLPTMSDQKLNQYLGMIEGLVTCSKRITFHIARHSFATLVLSHDVPIENLARMMGHSSIVHTQVYAKILQQNVSRHSVKLANTLK